MLDIFKFSLEEVTATFDLSVNLNAGIKRAIKFSSNYGDDSDDYLAFVKDFRGVVARDRKSERDAFIVRHLDKVPDYFARTAINVFRYQVEEVARGIVDRYADEFNTTYRDNGDGAIEVLDGANFERIVAEAYSETGPALVSIGLPDNNFLRIVVLLMVFTDEVSQEIRKRVAG